MYKISKYGITLKRLEANEIELVRTWRNSSSIAEQMEFREFIHAEQQVLWFNQLKESNVAYYYVIYVTGKPIGLVHLNLIDFGAKSAHAGLFIGNVDFIGTGAVLGASLLILQFAFFELNLETIFAKVRNVNTPAIEYNQILGFALLLKHNEQFNMYELSKDRFIEKQSYLEHLVLMVTQS
ncbi:MAG: GNAT family N-acetyltransferase [bacterium]|nr:GNAT family N-acetyltransferase [bacterium]